MARKKKQEEEKKTHHPFEDWMVDALTKVMQNRQHISKWELDFVKDRAGAFDKFGFNAVITDKQIEVLKSLSKKIEFKISFKEMENDNSPW